MKIFYGTIIVCLTILLSGISGIIVNKKINKNTATNIFNIIALIAMITGIGMALKSENILISMITLILGNSIGLHFKIDERINKRIGVKDIFDFNSQDKTLMTGVTISSMISLIGPLAIMGSLEDGINGDISLLTLKAGFDGITTFVLASSLGKGVILSVIPIMLFQMALSTLGYYAGNVIPADLLTELSATGGIILIAMAFSIMGVKKFNVISLLIGLLFVPIFYFLFMKFGLI